MKDKTIQLSENEIELIIGSIDDAPLECGSIAFRADVSTLLQKLKRLTERHRSRITRIEKRISKCEHID